MIERVAAAVIGMALMSLTIDVRRWIHAVRGRSAVLLWHGGRKVSRRRRRAVDTPMPARVILNRHSGAGSAGNNFAVVDVDVAVAVAMPLGTGTLIRHRFQSYIGGVQMRPIVSTRPQFVSVSRVEVQQISSNGDTRGTGLRPSPFSSPAAPALPMEVDWPDEAAPVGAMPHRQALIVEAAEDASNHPSTPRTRTEEVAGRGVFLRMKKIMKDLADGGGADGRVGNKK